MGLVLFQNHHIPEYFCDKITLKILAPSGITYERTQIMTQLKVPVGSVMCTEKIFTTPPQLKILSALSI